MSRQRVAAGAELDFLTPSEAVELMRNFEQRVTYRTARANASGKTDASGAITLDVYTVPPGFELELGRVNVDADSATPAVPFSGAGAFVALLRGAFRVDWSSLVAGAGSLPFKTSYSGVNAPLYRNGEKVLVQLVAGPASTGVTVEIQGRLRRAELDV